MASIRTIFLRKQDYWSLLRLIRWYTDTPAEIELPDEVHEQVQTEADQIALPPDSSDWLEAWAIRRGVVYATSNDLGRVRFAVRPAKNRRPCSGRGLEAGELDGRVLL